MAERPFAVVTGASSGIGLELARKFAQHGFDLLVTAEDGGIAQVASELGGPVNVLAIQADLALGSEVEKLCAAIEGTRRPVDALALNAGVGVYGDFARETSLADELNLIRVNIEANVHLAKRLTPAMVARKAGRILFTSSVAGTAPGPLYAVYAASKAFIQSFSEALRDELSDAGVSVTALIPGPTDTHFFERAGMQNTKAGQGKKDDPAEVAQAGFEALMRGDHQVIAGSFTNKVQAAIGRLMPDPAKAKAQRAQLEPEPKHH